MIDAAEVESTVALPLATAPGVRNRALTTQYKLDQVWQIETQRTVVASCRRLDITYLLCVQLEKQRELQQQKRKQKLSGLMVAKDENYGGNGGLRMIEDDDDDDDVSDNDAPLSQIRSFNDRGANVSLVL